MFIVSSFENVFVFPKVYLYPNGGVGKFFNKKEKKLYYLFLCRSVLPKKSLKSGEKWL